MRSRSLWQWKKPNAKPFKTDRSTNAKTSYECPVLYCEFLVTNGSAEQRETRTLPCNMRQGRSVLSLRRGLDETYGARWDDSVAACLRNKFVSQPSGYSAGPDTADLAVAETRLSNLG
jgi:hypothetical protein